MIIKTEILIAGIKISFWTDHVADIECLKETFLYHREKDNIPYRIQNSHDVIITSSKNCLKSPTDMPLIWDGHVHNTATVRWYNQTSEPENVIRVADDILIRHLPQKNLTICCVMETKSYFSKSHRPLLSNFILFLLHNITSMYGKYTLHASCVAREGHAYLFLGQSGSGKTTISEILGKAGWKYMGDDLVFISRDDNNELIVDSFLSKAKIADPKNAKKDFIDVIGDWHFNFTYKEKLSCIIKPQQTKATKKSILIPSSQAEAFTWLIYASNNVKIQYHPQQWMDICGKASFLPAYTMMFADRKYFDPAILDAVVK
jgi:hypothetical protein